MCKFRLLRADEIELRVAQMAKDSTSAMFLLYKDARADMNILDECVGSLNWKREHTRDNHNCVVSIFDTEKKEWVSKEDTGVESNTEAEKGLASDSFKRACVNWGIGRELYTAPKGLWIKAEDGENIKYARFSVGAIHYTSNRCIDGLVIIDANKRIRYAIGVNIIVDSYLAENDKAKEYYTNKYNNALNYMEIVRELITNNKI